MPPSLEVDRPRQNRGSFSSSAEDVRQLMGDIASGWSSGAVDHATCVQVSQGDALTIVREDTLRRLAMSSDGDVPVVAPGSKTYASLACGHTNAGLRAIGSNSGWSNTALRNAPPDPRLNDAVRDGLNWNVIRSRFERSNPEPDDLLAAGSPRHRYTVQV